MALTRCRECRREVASAAPACPGCGATEPGHSVHYLAYRRACQNARADAAGLHVWYFVLVVGLSVAVPFAGIAVGLGEIAIRVPPQ